MSNKKFLLNTFLKMDLDLNFRLKFDEDQLDKENDHATPLTTRMVKDEKLKIHGPASSTKSTYIS